MFGKQKYRRVWHPPVLLHCILGVSWMAILWCIPIICVASLARDGSLRNQNPLRYTSRMRSRAARVIATVLLVTCLVCPLVELFDHWNHTIQTGNDTEYALIVLALCMGMAYSFARFFFKSALLAFVAKSVFASCAQKFFFSPSCRFPLLFFDATSPPSLPLRI